MNYDNQGDTGFVLKRMQANVCYAIPGLYASDASMIGTRAGDFEASILKNYPTGSAPLLAISSGMQSKPARDVVTHWFEEDRVTSRFEVLNAAGTGTSVTLSDGSPVVPGTILRHDTTGEYLLVTAVSGDVATVVRGIGNTTVTSISINTFVTRVGNAHREGSSMPTAVVNQGRARFNYTQIFRNSWSVTGSVTRIEYITGSQVAKNKADCAMFHAEDIERAYLWGKKDMRTLSGTPFRTMDGLEQQIRTYGGQVVAQDNAHTNMLEIRTWLQTLYAYNVKGKPNERIFFAGNGALMMLNEMVRKDSAYDITFGETSFGLKFSTFVSPFGDAKIMTHPLFNEHALWTSNIMALHPGAIRRRPFRPTFPEDLDRNGSRAGVDADQGVLTTETSIELMAALTSGLYTGITAATDSNTSS